MSQKMFPGSGLCSKHDFIIERALLVLCGLWLLVLGGYHKYKKTSAVIRVVLRVHKAW
jgi:hypothetical protein